MGVAWIILIKYNAYNQVISGINMTPSYDWEYLGG